MIEICSEYLPVWCTDSVILSCEYMFRVNLQSVIARMSKNSLLEKGAISGI